MTAHSYVQLFKSTGVAGNTELGVRVFDVSSGDTIDFAADFSRIGQVAFMGRSRAIPEVSLIASTNYVSKTVLNLPTLPSLTADAIDLLIIGPAAIS